MLCAYILAFPLGLAAVFANSLLRDGFNLIAERQGFDDQTTDEYDGQWLFAGSSDLSLKNPSDGTSIEAIPNELVTADHPAFSSNNLQEISSSAAEPEPIVGLSKASTAASCNPANTPTSKRSILPENQEPCPDSAIPLKAIIPAIGVSRNRKNSAIRRPSKDKAATRPPSSSPEYGPCKHISARPDLGIEFPLFLVSCGGPLVGDEDRPDAIFNCVLGKYFQVAHTYIQLICCRDLIKNFKTSMVLGGF